MKQMNVHDGGPHNILHMYGYAPERMPLYSGTNHLIPALNGWIP